MPPGMKVKIASGFMRGDLGKLGLEIEIVQRNVGFLDDLALVVALEAGERVLAGLIVRREQVDLLVAAVLRDLAENLVVLVVLVGGREEVTGCSSCRRGSMGPHWC